MASTITRHGAGGAFSKPLMNTNRTAKLVSLDLNITSYATGGEDLSSIHNEFSQVLGVLAGDPNTGRTIAYDYTNKKLQAFETGAALSGPLSELEAAVNLGVIRVLFIGY